MNVPAVILLQAQLEERQSQVLEFVKELRDVGLSNTARARTENTRIIFPAVAPENPVYPKTGFNVVVAGLVGFMGALVAAFFLEFLAQTSRQATDEHRGGRRRRTRRSRRSRHPAPADADERGGEPG